MSALVVSAADFGYFRCLLQWLSSLDRHDPQRSLRAVVYDLGLAEEQRRTIATRFTRVELRALSLSTMPAFMRIRPRAVNSNAWKPQVLEALLRETDLPILWFDSATVLLQHPARLLDETQKAGFYAPFGGHSSIARWTHPDTAAYFGLSLSELTQRMRASGVLGVDPTNSVARSLVQRWAAACRVGHCVAPEGATRAAHNFDQSVLNILLLDAVRSQGLRLSDDEIDVSSTRPLPELRTRNKVSPSVPLACDPLVRAYYAMYRALDIAVLRYRRSRFCFPFARDAGAPVPW